MNPSKLWTAVSAMTVLILAFTVMMGISKLAGSTKSVMGTLITLGVIIVALGLVLIAMNDLDIQSTVANALILASFLVALTGIIVLIHFVGKLLKNGKSALTGLLLITAMLVPLLGIAGILNIMSGVENAIKNTIALTMLVTAMSVLMVGLDVIVKYCSEGRIITGIVLLAAMMVPLLAAAGTLAIMSGVENSIKNTLALIILVTAMSVLMVGLDLIAKYCNSGTILIGIGLLTLMMVPLLAAVGVLALMSGVDNAISNTKTLITLVSVLTLLLLPLTLVGSFGLAALAGIGVLLIFIAALGGFVAAVGYFVTNECPQLERFIDVGIPIIEKLAHGMGSVISSFTTGLLSGLPAIGDSLSGFMESVEGFVEGAKTITPETTEGIGSLVSAIVLLTKADMMNGIGKFLNLTNGDSLGTFGEQLSEFGSGLGTFFKSLTDAGLNEEKLKTVDIAARAIKRLAGASAQIPNSGGFLGGIVGNNDLGTFADQFPKLGEGLRDFLAAVGEFGEEQLAIIGNGATAVVKLTEAANSIPNSGGFVGGIVGNNDLGTFADQFPKLGEGLRDFLAAIGNFGEEQLNVINFACDAVVALADASGRIENSGGVLGWLVGENDLGTFASQFPLLGEGIRGFVNKIGELTSGELVSSARALEVVELMTDLANVDVAGLHSKIESLGKTMTTFGDNIVKFSNTMDSGNITISLKNAVNGVRDLVDALAIIPADKVNHLRTISESLRELGRNGVRSFIEAYSGTSAINSIKNAATAMVQAFVTGVKSNTSNIVSTFEAAVAGAYARITTITLYGKFVTAGANLAQGFANGISNNTYKVTTAAEVMASAAIRAAKERLDEHSPSREFYSIGDFAVQGFANALIAGTTNAYGAGSKMADAATTGLSDAISKISDIIEYGIDSQPVIRPVLDLDDVRNGASQIGGMLSMSPSVGVLSKVNAVASSMNAMGQNGANDGVISELGKLRKDISSLKHITYQIDGVTYGEGSDVAEAIETLVRAAIIERRV